MAGVAGVAELVTALDVMFLVELEAAAAATACETFAWLISHGR